VILYFEGDRNVRFSFAVTHIGISVRSRFRENGVIKIESDQKKIGLSSYHLSSHWSLKSHNSQYSYAKFRIKPTAFSSSSMALCPNRVNDTRVIAELAVSGNEEYEWV
jgi:hypothetical protein